MPTVTPMLPRRHHDNLARHHIPKPRWSDGDDTLLSHNTARDGISFHRNGNEFDVPGHIKIILCRLWWPSARFGQRNLRMGLNAEPRAISSHISGCSRAFREDQIARGDHLLRALLPPAPGRQSSPLIPIVINRQHRNRFSNHKSLCGHCNIVFKGLPERPELFIVAVCVDNDFVDQSVQFWRILTPSTFCGHSCLPSSTAPHGESIIR